MTTITVKNGFSANGKTQFEDSIELLEYLSESFGTKIVWKVSEAGILPDDKLLIEEAKNTPWEQLDNI